MNDILSISFFTYVISYILFLYSVSSYSVSSYSVSSYTVFLYCSVLEHLCSVMTHTHYLMSEESIVINQGFAPNPTRNQSLDPSVLSHRTKRRQITDLPLYKFIYSLVSQGRCKAAMQLLDLHFLLDLIVFSCYDIIGLL